MTELRKLLGERREKVQLSVCRLPTTQRMRYWKPALALAGLVSGYHLYAIEVAPGKLHRDVFQPAWANLRVVLTRGTQ